MNGFRLTQKLRREKRNDIVDSCYVIRAFIANTSLQLSAKKKEKEKKEKSCLSKPGDELNKTNLELLINCGSDPPHLFRDSRNTDVIKRHIHSRK